MVEEKLRRELGLRDLILFYVVSGIGLRWIATAAASGQSAVLIWLLAWCGFFLPLAGCVLELSSRYPQEGGIYVWTRQAYGEFPGFISAWTYWMSNLPYFPATLFFAAASLLYAFPRLQHLSGSNVFYLIFTAGALVFITALNVAGLNFGKWLNNIGAIGTIAPILALIVLALASYRHFGSATHFTLRDMTPRTNLKNLVFWSTIFFGFAGCEAGSFMGEEIRDARRTIPRALLAAGLLIAFSYIAGTAAMLVALPAASISGLSGFMSAIDLLCHRLGLPAMVGPVALLVAISMVGGTAAFLSSTARLPFVVGIDRYLPPIFGRLHPRWGTPYVALIASCLAAVFFGLLSQVGTSAKGAYDLLVSMGVVTTFIPYLFLFASVIRLQSQPFPQGAIRLPGGKPVAFCLACAGLFSTVAAIVFALFPSEDELHPLAAFLKIVVMTAILLTAGAAVFVRGERLKLRVEQKSK